MIDFLKNYNVSGELNVNCCYKSSLILTFFCFSDFPLDLLSLPCFSGEQLMQREKQLANVQALALKECLSK